MTMSKDQMLTVVAPTDDELREMRRIFSYDGGAADAKACAPFLVMMRRAIAHGFYTDQLGPRQAAPSTILDSDD